MNLHQATLKIPKKIKMFNLKRLIHVKRVQSKVKKVKRIKKKIQNKINKFV